jgi:hypothetical protein
VKPAKKVVCSGVMSRAPSSHARPVAFAAAFCALGIAAGCGQETFYLLPQGELGTAGIGLAAGGGSDFGGGGSSGNSGNSGSSGSGKAGAAGAGGRFALPPGGATGNYPCLGEGGCADEEPSFCSQSSPFCFNCFPKNECEQGEHDYYCDPDLKRCVECRRDTDCAPDEGCNRNTWRCAKSCTSKSGCPADPPRSVCNLELGLCGACNKDPDCIGYGPFDKCYLNTCVQCFDNRQCMSGLCLRGHCI